MNVHRRLAAEKFDDGCDIIRLTDASERNHGKNLFLGEIGGHIRVDQTGGDDVDANVPFSNLAGQRFTRPDQSCLGGGVVNLPSLPNLPGNRRHRDNPPTAGAQHGEEYAVHDVIESVEIRSDDRAPFFGLHPDQKIIPGDSSVENDNGRRGLLRSRAQGCLGGGEITDIEAEQFTFPADGFNLTLGFLGLFVIGAIGQP